MGTKRKLLLKNMMVELGYIDPEETPKSRVTEEAMDAAMELYFRGDKSLKIPPERRRRQFRRQIYEDYEALRTDGKPKEQVKELSVKNEVPVTLPKRGVGKIDKISSDNTESSMTSGLATDPSELEQQPLEKRLATDPSPLDQRRLDWYNEMVNLCRSQPDSSYCVDFRKEYEAYYSDEKVPCDLSGMDDYQDVTEKENLGDFLQSMSTLFVLADDESCSEKAVAKPETENENEPDNLTPDPVIDDDRWTLDLDLIDSQGRFCEVPEAVTASMWDISIKNEVPWEAFVDQLVERACFPLA